MLTACVVIPARYASSRFPAKMLAAQTGRPLVQHVVDQVRKCRRVSVVLVACDDQRIVDALAPFHTQCVMTRADHPSGSDRIAEVAAGRSEDIIVNVQGDEPEIEPLIIDQLIDTLVASGSPMATAAAAWPDGQDVANPNLVKVVCDQSGRALYFSRLPIPCQRDPGPRMAPPLLHVGLYAYQRDFILRFASWSPTLLEQSEKLEQLRALEHGARIDVLKVLRAAHGIDTPEQYQEFVQRMKGSR